MKQIEVSYEFYVNEYRGSSLMAASFSSLVREAEGIVNECTDGRIHQYMDVLTEEDMECVKYAICAVTEVLKAEKKKEGISAENTDGYSVTYDSKLTLTRKASKVARRYLLDTTLMSRRANYEYKH